MFDLAKAVGDIKNCSGIDSLLEAPLMPEIIIDTYVLDLN